MAIELYPLSWVGSTLVFWSLAGYGINRRLVFVLGTVSLTALFLLEFPVLQSFPFGGVPFLLFPAEALSVAVLLLLLRGHWGAVLKGLLLGLGSAALVLFAYGFGRQDIPFTLWGPYFPGSPPNPGGAWGLIGLLSMALFFLARLWSRPARSARQQPASLRSPAGQATSWEILAAPQPGTPAGGPAARMRQWAGDWKIEVGGVLALLLVSVGLIAPGLAGRGPLGVALDPMNLAVARVDRLYATVPGLGSFMFGLEADHRSIGSYNVTLTNFSCGSVFETGPIGIGGGAYSPIIEGQFTFSLQFGPDDPMQDQIKALTIKGRFDRTGTQVTGTWTAEVRDRQCSESWATNSKPARRA